MDENDTEEQSDEDLNSPTSRVRVGWDEQFKQKHEAGDDQLLDAEPLTLTSCEAEEWEWS